MEGRRIKLIGFTSFENVDDARRKLLEAVNISVSEEEVEALHSVGRISSRTVTASKDFPPYDRAAVDGLAVKYMDISGASESNPIPLKLAGRVEAGSENPPGLKEGEAIIVFTGAPIPYGADAVVPFEFSKIDGDIVYIFKSVARFRNISFRGEDFKKGDVLLERGEIVRPWHVAALAQSSIEKVHVFRKIRVAIINTGNEVYDPVTNPDGKLPNSTGPLIAAYVKELGGEPLTYGVIRDDREEISRNVDRALDKSDIVIITGGTSVGGKDLVPDALAGLPNSQLVFHGVNLRPGRTAGAFVIKGKPVLMLSGLPVACLVGLENFFKPILSKITGLKLPPEPVVEARLSRPIANAVGFRSYYRVAVYEDGGELIAEPLRLTGSGILSTLLKGNGLLVINEDVEGYDKGEIVKVRLLKSPYQGKPRFLY